jgi:hypothetical protein
MPQFRFRAVVTLDPPTVDARRRTYDSGTRHLLVHAWRLGESGHGKYLPAMILSDGGEPLEPGESQIATIVVTDSEALAYLAPGQAFTLWGQGAGHGIISRRVFTDQSPS